MEVNRVIHHLKVDIRHKEAIHRRAATHRKEVIHRQVAIHSPVSSSPVFNSLDSHHSPAHMKIMAPTMRPKEHCSKMPTFGEDSFGKSMQFWWWVVGILSSSSIEFYRKLLKNPNSRHNWALAYYSLHSVCTMREPKISCALIRNWCGSPLSFYS